MFVCQFVSKVSPNLTLDIWFQPIGTNLILRVVQIWISTVRCN